ncbi:hypothetical protein BH11MYX1_BH11MYX1_18720 [soil metagenome]
MLELWFDFSCPYAYLASQKAPGIARGAGMELVWKPMLLGGVFRGIGAGDGPMATLGPAKAAHNLRDMQRWAAIFGVPFQMPATHPMRTVRALRVLLALPHASWPLAIPAIYTAYWARAEDITRDDVLAAALAGVVSEPELAAAFAGADTAAIKHELALRTDEAIAFGIFGAPGCVVPRDHQAPLLIWGQDRIPWVEAALAGWDLESTPPGGPRPFGRDVTPFESPHTLEVYFDVASPYAYYALTQLESLARVTGTKPILRPILVGGLFRDIGQVDVPLFAFSAAKQRYVAAEIRRWHAWLGVPFEVPRKFPQRSISAQRLLHVAAPEERLRLGLAIARAMWAEQRDIEDLTTLRAILEHIGLPATYLDRISDPSIKTALIAEGTVAKERGVFGVPTFIVNQAGVHGAEVHHLVWGVDRLDLVTRFAAGWQA